MTSQQLDEERIFHIARQLADQSARSDYLQQVCAGDAALRERVEELLQVHEQEQSFLKSGGSLPLTAPVGDIKLSPGQQIGRYKLLQEIGEGGFGVVLHGRAASAGPAKSCPEGDQTGNGYPGSRGPLRSRATSAWR